MIADLRLHRLLLLVVIAMFASPTTVMSQLDGHGVIAVEEPFDFGSLADGVFDTKCTKRAWAAKVDYFNVLDDQQIAKFEADIINECDAKVETGGNTCQIVSYFSELSGSRSPCGALALADKHEYLDDAILCSYGRAAGLHSSRSEAEQLALLYCESNNGAGCEIVYSECITSTPVPPGLTLSEATLVVNERATAVYAITLTTQPTAEVIVTPSSDDPGAVSVSGALTFTTENWDTAQIVTVTGVQDVDDSDETVTVTHTAAGGGYDGVTTFITVEVVDSANIGVCNRTPQVRDAIFDVLNKRRCEDITTADLASIKYLDLGIRRAGNVAGRHSDKAAITALKSGDFAGLSGLEELNLGNNSLSTLPGDVFAGLSSLKKLHLSGNDLTALPVNVFAGLSSLEVLLLGGNNLAALDVSLFAGLSRLGWLDLAANRLTSLPAWVFRGLVNLKRLDLQENQLTALPLDIFAGLINLGVLYLQRNQLAALPAGIFAELSGLRQLNLEHNRLSTLPKGLFTGVSLESGPIHGPDLYLSILEPPYLGLGSNPGAPFTLTLQLERRDHTSLAAPGPANIGVTLVPDGTSPMSVPLPFDLPLSLWVKAGIYASLTRAAPIQAGRTASDDVTVYQRHPTLDVPIADPVTVSLHVDSSDKSKQRA